VEFFYLNRSMQFAILEAIPIHSTVTFRASVKELDGKSAVVSTGAFVGDEKCAQAETRLARVSAEEMEF
jgi:predicted thioesterase